MSWYTSPIQPIDPVVQSQTPKPPFRYMRDNFAGTGQNSFVQPPAQDQSQWQSLTNIMPIHRGVLNPRWGYGSFANNLLFMTGGNRLSNFQSDLTGTRAIVESGPSGVIAMTEAGLSYNSLLFTPESPGAIMRSITSRNFQYFCDGLNTVDTAHRTGDSLKWNGATSGGVTNIGIVNTDVTANTTTGAAGSNTIGPDPGQAASDVVYGTGIHPWVNPPGALTNNIATAATQSFNTGLVSTDFLQVLNFFNSMPSAPVGIQVAITYKATGGHAGSSGTFYVNLIKNGLVVGTQRAGNLIVDGNVHTVPLGGSADLWGTTFAASDMVQPNFGATIQLVANFGTSGNVVAVSYVTITAILGNISGTSNNSGTGVSIVNAAANGAITLVLGRTYYLIPAVNTTGHFGDLSIPSTNTGPVTGTEITLVLATYNDPQVTSKYVLATADGGDPSILYQAQVLAGFQVTSWAIVGNVVTFTGAFPAGITRYVIGNVVTVGGLVHGNYMNGQTITLTGATSTTLTGAFTHANDSATEAGVVGNLTFEIPNSVSLVVDNEPDTSLVLNQVMLFTDQFGDEFGVALNDPPPAGNLMIKHQGRLWMAGVAGATHSVFFSKSVTELTLPDGFIAGKYEESWPASNYFDVSDGAESVTGLLSDGTTLYIGTQSHIRRLLGSSPVNFQEPQIVHPQVGLINQEVWQLVYMQGAPSGAIWMTPDYRVIQGDFNTYVDIGTPVQDILNTLQSTAASLAHGVYVSDGEFELYILAVPYKQSTYCDTHLVFDLRTRQWFVWTPRNGSFSTLFNITQSGTPQWLFITGDGTGVVMQYRASAIADNDVAFTASATTTWMHLGEPTRRKLVNEITIYGNPLLTVTITGANNQTDFASGGFSVVYNRALRQSPFGTWNLYLTGSVAKYRYYQFTFQGNTLFAPMLGSYAISGIPLEDL